MQAQQRLASDAGTLPPAVMEELALLDQADLLVLQYPMWWHLPFVAYGVEAGLRYSDPFAVEARLRAEVDDFRTALLGADQRAPIPFNRMAEWGEDGRIVPGAPVHSPFIRRRRDLELD